MPHLYYHGVNDAFPNLVALIHNRSLRTVAKPSRYGDVLMVEEPVTITYGRPRDRVLFNTARDANPFFHLYESLWMLAGRNDVAPLAYYASRMKEFSDDGQTFNGAYGYRWREVSPRSDDDEMNYGTIDQLDAIINHLKAKPESRRAVLNMWNVEDDLLKIDDSKDVCCNLNACFSLRVLNTGSVDDIRHALDMTVFNRSNDLIWGLLGANVVHFSILQEWLAARLGVQVGVYHQVTNNLHVYTNNWQPEKWLDYYKNGGGYMPEIGEPHSVGSLNTEEVRSFVEFHKDGTASQGASAWFPGQHFLNHTANHMCRAFHYYKEKSRERARELALGAVDQVECPHWRRAGKDWLLARKWGVAPSSEQG